MTTSNPHLSNDCPGWDVVTINQAARELQSALAEAHSTPEQLQRTEDLCMRIHRSTCAILMWVDKERNYP
jgi:hypothetical protein